MAPPQPVAAIALVGRPNVGKSTLFNRLVGSRKALVAATPGLTRDRRVEEVRFNGFHFLLVDTGGMAYDPDGAFSTEIVAQVEAGVESAAAVWLMVDAVEGLNPFDTELYRWLLRGQKPVFVIVNKADNVQRMTDLSDFYALGAEHILALSAIHGHGIEQALTQTAAVVPIREAEVESGDPLAERPVRITFLGRPNVGKSSLVNLIVDDARMIVSEVAGTTREAVDVPFERQGQSYLLIDTAGIRRRARTKEYLEKIGVLSSLGALRRTDVTVLVLDASEPIAEQDARIASYILEQRRGIVIAMNKWDLLAGNAKKIKEFEFIMERKLRFLQFAPRVRISAVDGSGLEQLFKEIQTVYENFSRRIQTADLNRVVQMSVLRRSPPAQGRVPTKVFYGSQVRERPPTFCFVTNHPKQIRESYTRYMEGQLRYHFGLKGTPLHILWKGRREEGKQNRGRRS
ncbi:MAG: ribosome biogenesis GTPase Der [SAR324 cluster bacterium]|nr:ribosome biogenesis GTPase Der [SAR324 cluster bacterium]MCZ6629595.1 ribosome biogenesis GTPase Der [SAR324 cluster bacterium]MCZ6730818.1 ribosome biogenesis GTPase Der [SAR324 cluster bacterium]